MRVLLIEGEQYGEYDFIGLTPDDDDLIDGVFVADLQVFKDWRKAHDDEHRLKRELLDAARRQRVIR